MQQQSLSGGEIQLFFLKIIFILIYIDAKPLPRDCYTFSTACEIFFTLWKLTWPFDLLEMKLGLKLRNKTKDMIASYVTDKVIWQKIFWISFHFHLDILINFFTQSLLSLKLRKYLHMKIYCSTKPRLIRRRAYFSIYGNNFFFSI